MLDFVEVFSPTTLNAQTTEEKQHGDKQTKQQNKKSWLLPNYVVTIIPGGEKIVSHEISSGWLNYRFLYFIPM